MHRQRNELAIAEKEFIRLVKLAETYKKSANNTHQSNERRSKALARLHETEADIRQIQRKIDEFKRILELESRRSKQDFENTIRPFSSVFQTQETQYLIALNALEEDHERAINNAIHFREFAELAEPHTVQRSKRMELYEYWERRADNIERRINEHIRTSTPEALRASELETCGHETDPAEKTNQRPGNHLPGPRPKGKALQTTP